MENTKVLLVDGSTGIYGAKCFIEKYDRKEWHILLDDAEILKDIDHKDYWEVWDDVMTYAYFEEDGHRWTLYQDGDLWAVRDDYDWEND